MILSELHTGARLLVQCKKDWRMAVVSKNFEDKTILQVCSPTGRTYRRKFASETALQKEGGLLILGEVSLWREDYVKYDFRW
jgi:hypothetical protein